MLHTANEGKEQGEPDQAGIQGLSLANRRQVLGVSAVAASGAAAVAWGGLANAPLAAQASGDVASRTGGDFLALSIALIEREDLSAALARRIEAALLQVGKASAANLSQLSALVRQGGGAAAIQTRAQAAGLGDVVTAVVAAWYMGSVDNSMNAPTFAYYDALMWKTVADGLPVQTYCWGKPGWWTEPPPPAGVPLVAPDLPTIPEASHGQ